MAETRLFYLQGIDDLGQVKAHVPGFQEEYLSKITARARLRTEGHYTRGVNSGI